MRGGAAEHGEIVLHGSLSGFGDNSEEGGTMKRWRVVATVAAFFALALTVMAVAGGAAATTTPQGLDPTVDPQTTNVPYVAWAGEEIQFQKCYDVRDLEGLGLTRGTAVP